MSYNAYLQNITYIHSDIGKITSVKVLGFYFWAPLFWLVLPSSLHSQDSECERLCLGDKNWCYWKTAISPGCLGLVCKANSDCHGE